MLAVEANRHLFSLGHPRNRLNRCLRSEEHTSELQSLRHLVCRLLLEKKKIERARRSQHYIVCPDVPVMYIILNGKGLGLNRKNHKTVRGAGCDARGVSDILE